MLIPTILLVKDTAIIQGLIDGSLKRFGGVIRETATGRIVRHLVETPGFTTQIMDLSLSPVMGGPSIIANAIGHTVTIRKLGQVQQTLNVTNQMLSKALGLTQIAAGASVLNLGVSVAGFAYMGYKLHQLQKSLGTIQQSMEEGFKGVEGRLDQISGQLGYLCWLVEDNRQEQKRLGEAIAELHRAFLVKEVSDLEAAILNRKRFPSSPVQEDVKTAASARQFLSHQALTTCPSLEPQNIMIADVAIQGWAIATATEAYILLETGHVLEAKQILGLEIPKFRELVTRWTEVLLRNEQPELSTVYRFLGDQFKDYIAPERVDRIAYLSPFDKLLTEDQKRQRLYDIEVEFEMSYSTQFDVPWMHRQVALADYLDALSELLARMESLEAFANLCDDADVQSSQELLPDSSYEPGLYLLNPSGE